MGGFWKSVGTLGRVGTESVEARDASTFAREYEHPISNALIFAGFRGKARDGHLRA